MALLISTQELLCSLDHLNGTSFLTKCCKGLTTWEKFGTNLQTKLILPKKDCIAFLELGRLILEIASVHSGSMIMPSLEMMKPKKLPSVTAKIDFFGLREIPYFLHILNTYFKADKCSCHFLEYIVISSKYTMTELCIKPLEDISIALLNVYPTFINPKGILL